jgi:hypothetical protein
MIVHIVVSESRGGLSADASSRSTAAALYICND